jgi:glucans biosynthesis protein
MKVGRRPVLRGLGALAAMLAGLRPSEAAAAMDGLRFGEATPFSFDSLIAQARERAKTAYVSPPRPVPEAVASIDYDAHGKLKFKTDYALFREGPGTYPITFVFMGNFFPKTVRMHMIEENSSREVLYDPAYFVIPEDSPARALPPDASGFAGFWIKESRKRADWATAEPWATFLGGAYFRGVGELGQVGLSARGVALNVAAPTPEEFPDFIAHWFSPADEGEPVIVHSLLDGPSLTGAYRFKITRTTGVVMEIEKHLFLRRDIERLGIAPLTAMYWFGEHGRERLADWRPEVHDADGLAMWTGSGERIWRSLNNPTRIFHTSFSDASPKGFGLSQRDRAFDHYLDGVGYEKRPSAWVEPLGDWGRGVVQLVELPTDDEIYDNIATYWLPAKPAKAGDALQFSYRLHWLSREPGFPPELARVVATRMGRGGQPGKPRPRGVAKFTIEFLGGRLASLPFGIHPEPVIWTSRGTSTFVQVEAVPNDVPGHWRIHFDLTVDGRDPVDLRVYLRQGTETLSETWLYLYEPTLTA